MYNSQFFSMDEKEKLLLFQFSNHLWHKQKFETALQILNINNKQYKIAHGMHLNGLAVQVCLQETFHFFFWNNGNIRFGK